jgi:hypothetical protein
MRAYRSQLANEPSRMATKDISDLQVVGAYHLSKISGDWPEDILMKATNESEKVCYYAMARAAKRGLIDYGVSLRSGWITEKGHQLIKSKPASQ